MHLSRTELPNTSPANSGSVAAAASLLESKQLNELADRAERLLSYAAESGIDVDDQTREAVLAGIRAREDGWSEASADRLITALTRLAATVRPVTVQSLTASADAGSAKRQQFMYAVVMWALGALLLPFSIANFCVSKLSEAVQNDLHVAQDLGVKLNNELYRGTDQNAGVTQRRPVTQFSSDVTQADVLRDLTQFAVAIRALNTHAQKLDRFILDADARPYSSWRSDQANSPLELTTNLADLVTEENERVLVFQRVRDFAQNVQTDASIYYGAVLNCLLPMLYAILGTLAYLLRTFEQQLARKTFTQADGHTARFAVAAIGGFVVGLFNLNIATDSTGPAVQPATISPLALAFLVGYATDVFFSFLEGLIRAFGRRGAGAGTSGDG